MLANLLWVATTVELMIHPFLISSTDVVVLDITFLLSKSITFDEQAAYSFFYDCVLYLFGFHRPITDREACHESVEESDV